MTNRRLTGFITLGCALLGAAFLAGWGVMHARQATPTAVAVIDFDRLINQLDEFKRLQSEIESEGAAAKAFIDNLTREIENIEDELKQAKLSPEEQRQRRAARIVKSRTREVEAEVRKVQLDYKFNDGFRELYVKANTIVGQVAQEQGYDVVLLDDGRTPIPSASTVSVQAMMNAVASRKVLYAGKSIDITDLVATRMNNNFAAGN